MSNWISVKDRLPDKKGNYLVTKLSLGKPIVDCCSFAKNLYKIDKYAFYPKERYARAGWYDYDSEYGYYEKTTVIAWQELPEPYKEAANE